MENIIFDVYEEESSLYSNTLELLLQENSQYTSIIESCTYITEFELAKILNNISLKKIITFIFKKFIDIISQLWRNFKSLYMKFTSSSTLIKKYKSYLQSIDEPIVYEKNYIIYDHLSENTRFIFFELEINKLYSEIREFISDLNNNRSTEEITSFITSKFNSLDDTNYFLEEIRGKSINKNKNISADDYSKEVHRYFESGMYAFNVTLTPEVIDNITSEYLSNKSIERCIIKDKDKLINTSNKAINNINKLEVVNFDRKLNPIIGQNLSSIIKSYCDKIQGICNIYTILFGIELEEFKKKKIQDTEILTWIIRKGIREGIIK